MEDWEKAVVALVIAVVAKVVYSKWIDHLKDVHEHYLSGQSNVAATRKANESAIYSSNKLFSSLRGGLEIRYDHYKIRSGNLHDVWSIYMSHYKKNQNRTVVVHGESVTAGRLNASVKKVRDSLVNAGITQVCISEEDALSSLQSVVVVLAAFVGQITLNINGSVVNDGLVVYSADLFSLSNGISIGISETEDLEFEYTYEPRYDAGTPLKLTSKSGKVISETLFTHANLASSIASFLKHLPESHALGSDDSIKLFLSKGEVVNSVVKLLSSFVADVKQVAISSLHIDTDFEGSLVIAVDESKFIEIINERCTSLSPIKSLRLKRSLNLLAQGVFSPVGSTGFLRLIYLSHKLGSELNITLSKLNEYRALLGCRIVLEQTHPAVLGPIIQTDLFDYRLLSLSNMSAYGCICQSVEIKLVEKAPILNYSGSSGEVYIRGYSIGKVETKVIGLPDEPSLEKKTQSEGFMPLGITGRWGGDGCLYI